MQDNKATCGREGGREKITLKMTKYGMGVVRCEEFDFTFMPKSSSKRKIVVLF